MTDELLTSSEIARRLNLSRPTVYRHLSGVTPTVDGKRKLYPLNVVADRLRQTDTPPDEANAKARLTMAQAERQELKLQAERGELVKVEVVVTAVENALSVLRTNLLAVPAKLAPRLEMVSKEQADKLLTDEISRLLYDLSNSNPFTGAVESCRPEEPTTPA